MTLQMKTHHNLKFYGAGGEVCTFDNSYQVEIITKNISLT
jgi:hypothetical protein